MKKLSSKAKKITMITGIAVVCIGVLSAVLYQQANASANLPTAVSSASSSNLVVASSGSVSVNPITENDSSIASGTAGTGSAFVPEKGKTVSAPLTKASKPTTPSKPVIQGDSQKGQQPTNKALTNKAQKPAYVTPPKAPSTQKSSGSTTTNKQSNGGSTTSNKTSGGSDPIFGNNYGTGGQGTTIGNGDGDINKQIGIMD